MNEADAGHADQAAPRPGSPVGAMLEEIATDAIRYWEPRRLIYNAVLALVVIGYFVAAWPASQAAITLDHVLMLFVMAVFANLCYCAAYVADIFAQFSDFRALWLRIRWLPLIIGITLAAIFTRFVATGFFSEFPGQ